MPFVSQKQRALFYAAKHDPQVRKRHGMSKEDADKMVAHDEGGKLPMIKRLAKAKKRSK